MQLSTGQTCMHRLQPTHSASIDFEMALAVLFLRDRLMRGVLAGDVAKAALDAFVLVDARLDVVVEIQELPVGDVADRAAAEVVDARVALAVHPVATGPLIMSSTMRKP